LEKSLAGKVVLITGGTRGIGKAIALEAAQRGAGVIITYRDSGKTNRANRVLRVLEATGATILLKQLDITIETDRRALLQEAKEKFGKVDALVLNAAGGLEAGKGDNYAMVINRDSNIGLVNEAIELGLTGAGAWAIYLTSTWAHEYGKVDPPEFYLPVATTKRVAETDLRGLIPELSKLGIGLGVVVAPLVSDTGAYAIMKLKFKEAVEQETKDAGMVSPEAVAEAVLSYLASPAPESGHTIYVQ
jgi:NAD(P)-dependent dehydrogenase (short-subunit alcohol dehydrogenase family)